MPILRGFGNGDTHVTVTALLLYGKSPGDEAACKEVF